jgi:acetoin utilization deacetylase AcuC-like enzyme
MAAMERVVAAEEVGESTLTEKTEESHQHTNKRRPKIISLLEGGYDVRDDTRGLPRCVVAHVDSLRESRYDHLL